MRGLELGLDPVRLMLARMYREGAIVDRDEERAARLEADMPPERLSSALRLLEAIEREFSGGAV
jgi:hypothetical protein